MKKLLVVCLILFGASASLAQDAPRRWKPRGSQLKLLSYLSSDASQLEKQIKELNDRREAIITQMNGLAAEIRSDCRIPESVKVLKPDFATGEVIEVVSGG